MEAEENVGYLVEEEADWFKKLLDEMDAEIQSELDQLVVLLHSFLLEMGLTPAGGGLRPPDGWRASTGVYTIRYSLQQQEEEEAAPPTCQLTVARLGDTVIKVHGTHLPEKKTFTLSTLQPEAYVRVVHGGSGDKFVPTNLRSLARTFKNTVGLPLLTTARSHLGLLTSGLAGLPPELLLSILQRLGLPDLLNVGRSCKQIHAVVAGDNELWKLLVARDFPQLKMVQPVPTWLTVYKSEYRDKKRLERQRREEEERRRRREEFLPPPDPMFPFGPLVPDPGRGPFAPPPVPGMVGGDYDRFPFPGGIGPAPLGLPRPRFDPPGPNFPQRGPRRGNFPGGGFGGGGGGFGFF